LLTHAEKQNVPILKYDEQATKRRWNYQNWVARLRPVLEMFKQTASVFNQEIIIVYKDPLHVGNKALFILVNAKVDNYFRNLRMVTSETATHFLRRFIIGRNQAELAGNSYDDIQLVDYLLSAMSSVTNQAYLTNLSVFQMKRDVNQAVTSRVQKLALMQLLPQSHEIFQRSSATTAMSWVIFHVIVRSLVDLETMAAITARGEKMRMQRRLVKIMRLRFRSLVTYALLTSDNWILIAIAPLGTPKLLYQQAHALAPRTTLWTVRL